MCGMQIAQGIVASAATLERAKAQDKQAMMDEYWARNNEKVQMQGIANQRDEITTIASMQKRRIAKEQIRSQAEAKAALGEGGTAGNSAALLLQSVGFQSGTAAQGIDTDAGFALRDTNYEEMVIRTDATQAVSNARRSRPDRVGTFFAMGSNGFNAFMGSGSTTMDDPASSAARARGGSTSAGGRGGLESFKERNVGKDFDFSVGVGSGQNQGRAMSRNNTQTNPRGGV